MVVNASRFVQSIAGSPGNVPENLGTCSDPGVENSYCGSLRYSPGFRRMLGSSDPRLVQYTPGRPPEGATARDPREPDIVNWLPIVKVGALPVSARAVATDANSARSR